MGALSDPVEGTFACTNERSQQLAGHAKDTSFTLMDTAMAVDSSLLIRPALVDFGVVPGGAVHGGYKWRYNKSS